LKKNKCIYIIDASIDITGAFICVKNEAEILGDTIDFVLVLPENTKIKNENLKAFKKVIKLPIVNIRKSFLSILYYFPVLAYSSFKLKKMMQKDNCTYIQVNDYYLMHGVMIKIFGFKGKVITWVRIDPTRYGSFLSKYWLKYTYRYSDKVIAVSKFILDKLPIHPKNKLVYDAVTSIKTQSNSSKVEIKKLVYISNYIKGKGQEYAIEAFGRIASKYNDVELHFYGGDMGLDKNRLFKNSLEKIAEQTPAKTSIFFHGFIKDIASILSDTCIALNFSESESFSMTCLEASSYAVPVIATKSGGPEEIIVDRKTGYLVDIGDIDAITSAIKTLLDDKALCGTMGKAGQDYVHKVFSQNKYKLKMEEVFL